MASHLVVWLLSLLNPFATKVNTTTAVGVIGSGGGVNRGRLDAIYCLGDSISDTGNAVRIPGGTSSAASPPYGSSLNGPTGRFSDGLLMIDYFASALNLPYLPPYLDKTANFDHGVNFAVAGATALDQTFFQEKGVILPFTPTSLDVEMQWFSDHLANSVCPSGTDCLKKFKKALFFVGEIGGNDYNYALMQGKQIEEVKNFVPPVVGRVLNASKQVIEAGAVQLIVPGNFPIGCIPIYLTQYEGRGFEYDERGCLKQLNSFAEFHNQYLQKSLEELKKDHPAVTIIYADYYYTFLGILDNPSSYGIDIDSMLKACCGVRSKYNFNMNLLCGSPGVPACANASKFISWDGIHLTQKAYKSIANQILSNNEFLKKWRS